MEENKKNTGWTEAEMNEGFVEQAQPETSAPFTDMGRRQDLAGKTVCHDGYEQVQGQDSAGGLIWKSSKSGPQTC